MTTIKIAIFYYGKKRDLPGCPIYAESQEEADAVSQAFKDIISENARIGVAVTAAKVTKAVQRWGGNTFIRGRITDYFKHG